MEQYFRGASIQNWKSLNSTAIEETETNPGVGFECNICLDLVRDPVVTFCGHLYCWPCIYRWINSQPDPTSPDHHHNPAQCPVCKTEVSEKSLIPLYGRGHDNTDTSKDQVSHLIPQRPPSPRCSQLHHRRNYVLPSRVLNHPTTGNYPVFGSMSHLADPMIGMFGEMMYARIFGNSETTLYTYPNSYDLAGSSSPRMRRHMVQTDKSLSRVCFFLCCCVMLCLLLF